MRLPESKYMLALSDGMGSGGKASEESSASIELFENFMSAGFDKKTALDIINSVLVLRTAEDRLSTLDLFIFDLKTGIGEFTKTGAVATFIKNGNGVERIQTSSLPIGILPYVSGETKIRRMKDGDIIIMVSDGVTDAFGTAVNFENYIRQLDIKNPQRASKEIIKKGAELGKCADDMTVIVSRIRKAK
jgi:stage II sporulation protein E